MALPPVRGEDLSEGEATYGFPPARGGRGAPSMFPRKLYQILCETDPSIITWDEDGTSWHIVNYEEYIEGVMPLFYRHNKLTSFQRQLNLYGFKKRGRDEKNPGHYYHPCFQRDRPEILGGVRRSYPVTSPKWVSQSSNGAPSSAMSAAGRATTAARAAAAARVAADAVAAAAVASEAGGGVPLSHKRVLGRGGGGGVPPPERPFVAMQEPNRLPDYRQLHHFMYQQQQHAMHGRGYGYGPPIYDEDAAAAAARMMEGEAAAAMMMVPGAGGGGREGAGAGGSGGSGPIGSRKRPPPPTGPLCYTLSAPAASDGMTAARQKRPNTQRGAGLKAECEHGESDHIHAGDPWSAGPATERPYHPAKNRHRWEAYRDQDDAHPPLSMAAAAAAAAGWYESEESGLSRLTSCESGYSTWDELHAHPGRGDRDGGGMTGDPRRAAPHYPFHPHGPGMMSRRPMVGASPHHRDMTTSAMIPVHLLRHDRFGRYLPPPGRGGYDYPLPPRMYSMPPHAYPLESDSAAGHARRWRPVYNGGRVDHGHGGSVGGGDDMFDGWTAGGPSGRLAGEGPPDYEEVAPAEADAEAVTATGASVETGKGDETNAGAKAVAGAGAEEGSGKAVDPEVWACGTPPVDDGALDVRSKTEVSAAKAASPPHEVPSAETETPVETTAEATAEKSAEAAAKTDIELPAETTKSGGVGKALAAATEAKAPVSDGGGFNFDMAPKAGTAGVSDGVALLQLAKTAV